MIIDLGRLARVAWERRRRLIPLYAAVGTTAIAVTLLLPRWYASSATLVPSPGDGLSLDFSGLGNGLGSALGVGGVTTPQDQLRLVVRSRAVADSIVERFDLVHYWRLGSREQAREELARHVMVTTPLAGQVVVAVEARSPALARDMTAAYVSCATRVALRLKTSLALRRRLYLQARLGEVERDIGVASARVREFEQKNGAIALPQQVKQAMEAAGALRAEVALLETELVSARRYFTEQSPPVVALRDRIAARNRQIEALARKGGTMLPEGLGLPAFQQQYFELTREQMSLTAVSELLRRVYEQTRVEEANPVPTFSVLDAPELAERRSRPKRAMTVCIALALSMLYSIGFIQWQEMRAAGRSQPGALPQTSAEAA